MDQTYIHLLTSTPLFKGVAEADLKSLFEGGHSLKRYEQGSLIYLQNEQCTSLDVILQGSVTVQKIDIEGRILPINDFQAGEVLGENLLFSRHSAYPMTITATTNTLLLNLRKDELLDLCRQSRTFLENLLESLSGKTLILSEKLKSSVKTIREILIDFLLFEFYAQGSATIQLTISKKDLAEKIGIQRSSLSRELNKMRQDGLIQFDARTITLVDPQALQDGAGGKSN